MKAIGNLAPSWKRSYGKHDAKVYVKHYKWHNVNDHSEGFDLLDTIDVTERVEWMKLRTIVMQVEAYRRGKFGVVKPDSWTQEFTEKIEGVGITQVGALLKDVLLENDTNTDYHYKVGNTAGSLGDDCHLWELQIKIGDKDNDIWMSPLFSFIFGWVFDPAVDDEPVWDGVQRGNMQSFSLTGHDLFRWMGKVDSGWLGDYKNPMGVWGDRSADEEIDNDSHSFLGIGKAGNYPLLPVVREALHEMGVTDSNIEKLEIPVDTGSNPDYSTIDWEDTINLEDSVVKQHQLPQPFYWKTVGDVIYFVWVSYVSASAIVKVTAWDKVTGETTTERVNLHIVVTNPVCPQTAYPKRLWYAGSGNTFYLLMEDITPTPDKWYIWEITLSGTVGSVETSSSGTESALDDPTESYERHWGQCDLDMANRRLFCALTYIVGTTSYYDLGWFAMSDGAWNSEWASTSLDISWKIQTGTLMGTGISGFRVLRSIGTGFGVCAFVSEYNAGVPAYCLLKVLVYDSFTSPADPQLQVYDHTTPLSGVLHDAWRAYPLTEGRGSIGGFYQTKYYFQLASVAYAGGTRNGYWLEWTQGTLYSGYTCASVDSYVYRSFGSHGSASLTKSMGFSGRYRGEQSGDSDYGTSHLELYFYRTGGVKTAQHGGAYAGWGSGQDKEWPILGACSPSAYTGSEHNPKYRPFLMHKIFTDSEGTARRRTFLVIFSEDWNPQMSRDYPTDGGSLADEFQDIAFAYGLYINLSLWHCIIQKRYDGVTADVDASRGTITPDQYKWQGVKPKPLAKFEKVVLEYGGSDPAIYPTDSYSKWVLDVETNYLVSTARATKRAEELHTLHSKNRVMYNIEGMYLSDIEPLDIIKLHVPVPPGGQGHYDGKNKKYRYSSGAVALETLEEVLCMVTRVEIDGCKTRLQIVSLGSKPMTAI